MTIVSKRPNYEIHGDSRNYPRHIDRKFESFNIVSFTERSDPEKALIVQQMHGKSYKKFGFVYDSALDEDDRLHESIDRARGDNVTYYLATKKDGEKDAQASLRIIDIPFGGQPDDLPAFEYGKSTMYSGYEDRLRQASVDYSLREVSSLSLAEGAGSLASFELIRQIIQEAIKKRTNETWIVNFVTTAHAAIMANFSPKTIQRTGENLMIGRGNDHIYDEVQLVPVMIEPCKVLDQMVDYLQDGSEAEESKARVLKTLYFMLDGLESDEVSGAVEEYVNALPQGANNG